MPESTFPQIAVRRQSGDEPLHSEGLRSSFCLRDFWQWSVSDLVSSATRGIFAEFVVATALGIDVSGVRGEWDAFDLTTPSGIKIEVKSAAYVQTWNQGKLSNILFRIRSTRAWDAASNAMSSEVKRQADLYVFAVLHHQHKATIDPLDMTQWSFYVVPTRLLDARTRGQHSITIPSLKNLVGDPVTYAQLAAAVERAGCTPGAAV
jgi:hypothetical protein